MEAIPIIFLTVVAPLWIILHYITKWKQAKGFTPEDESSLSDLRTSADRLEERLGNLERILDDEVPDWRSRNHEL